MRFILLRFYRNNKNIYFHRRSVLITRNMGTFDITNNNNDNNILSLTLFIDKSSFQGDCISSLPFSIDKTSIIYLGSFFIKITIL